MELAVVFGVTGQDGSYLAKELLNQGYTVIGTTRDALSTDSWRLKSLNIHEKIQLVSLNLLDFRSVHEFILAFQPDYIYNLSGQTSVALSFTDPFSAYESISQANLNILESLRLISPRTKFFNAASSEIFGECSADKPADESSPCAPISPYGISKLSTLHTTKVYREAYGLFACSGILSNHESALRGRNFVTAKIIRIAKRIASGQQQLLTLGNVNVIRDWGWAPEYVKAMMLMLQASDCTDYLVATGTSHSLFQFASYIFDRFGLPLEDHLVIDSSNKRPLEISSIYLNPSKILRDLDWRSTCNLEYIVDQLCESEV